MSVASPSGRKPWQQPGLSVRSKYAGGTLARDQEYPRINCAFHPEEKITNFCKNFECLLPLCPRCVKIHTEEHMKNGTHGDFEIIGECFRFLEEELEGVMKSSKSISEQAHQLINQRKFKLNDVKTSYQQAKKKLLEELQRIFQEYEIELEERLQLQQISFSQEILSIEDSICFLVGNARKSADSIYSAYALEHLIQFYSHEMFSFEEGINRCQQQLQNFNMKPLDLQQDNTQLLNVRQCIRRFFDSGEQLSKNLAMATFNKLQSPLRGDFDTRSQNIQGLVRSNRKVFGEADTLKEPSIRMASVKNSQVTPSKDTALKFGGLAGRLATSSHLRTFETPLDGFDLSRSRGRQREPSESH